VLVFVLEVELEHVLVLLYVLEVKLVLVTRFGCTTTGPERARESRTKKI
jgi:hypothetical protein